MSAAVREEVLRRWPALVTDWDAFSSSSAAVEGDNALERMLVHACTGGAERALAVLEAEYFSRIADFVRRIDPSPSFAADVTQAVRARLLIPDADGTIRLASYNGSVPLLGWLRVIAIRTALNLRRGVRRSVPLDQAVGERAGNDPDLAQFRARHRDAFNDALARALGALSEEDTTLLRLHYLDGLSLEAMATMHGVHRATIARRIATARRQVSVATRNALATKLDLRASEVDSVVRLLKSDFDVSVERLLMRDTSARTR